MADPQSFHCKFDFRNLAKVGYNLVTETNELNFTFLVLVTEF